VWARGWVARYAHDATLSVVAAHLFGYAEPNVVGIDANVGGGQAGAGVLAPHEEEGQEEDEA